MMTTNYPKNRLLIKSKVTQSSSLLKYFTKIQNVPRNHYENLENKQEEFEYCLKLRSTSTIFLYFCKHQIIGK